MCTVTQCNHDLQRDYFLCFDAESKKPVQSFSVSPCQFREREDCISYLYYNSVQLSDKTPKGLRIPQHPVTWVKFFHLPLSYIICSLNYQRWLSLLLYSFQFKTSFGATGLDYVPSVLCPSAGKSGSRQTLPAVPHGVVNKLAFYLPWKSLWAVICSRSLACKAQYTCKLLV